MEGKLERVKEYKLSKDYRVWILLKYIYIGCADICFWWTVWNIADHLWPMNITKDGALSYLRGYTLIIGANLYYLLFRLAFNKICQQFYERSEKFVYPAVIVTKEEVMRDKPLKFKLLKVALPTFVYMLVVGYIQVWRGLFATFDYLVEILYIRHGVNRVLTSVLCQFVVGVTLAFTQRNNAVNLCPTHKIYKYDKLEELDGLLNLHVFNNFAKREQIQSGEIEETYLSERKESYDVDDEDSTRKVSEKKTSFTPLNHEFDIVQYTARKISGSIHRSSVGSNSPELSRKLSQTSRKISTTSRKLSSQEIFQKRRESVTKPSPPPLKLTSASNRLRKVSRQEFFSENTFSRDFEQQTLKAGKTDASRKMSKISTTSFLNENIVTIVEENEENEDATSVFNAEVDINSTSEAADKCYENKHTKRNRIDVPKILIHSADSTTADTISAEDAEEERISVNSEEVYENKHTGENREKNIPKVLFYQADISPEKSSKFISRDTVLVSGEEAIEYKNKNFEGVCSNVDANKPATDPYLSPNVHDDNLMGHFQRRTFIGVAGIRETYENQSHIGTHQAHQAHHTHQAVTSDHRGSYFVRDREGSCEKCFICRLIGILAYTYTIHHRQIFLHVFGGMFWSTTWKLFDLTVTETFFTGTASDIPGLALIAMLCHCINHLVLFQFKETASSVRWKTFWEFFCGIFTVCLWAPVWYIFDIAAQATGKKLKFQMVMNLLSFGSLAVLGVSINTAL